MPARLPDHVTLAPLVKMRQSFDQYACVRPARLLEGIRSPLAKSGPIDMVIVRENSEGEYVPCGGRIRQGEPEEVAIQSAVHTRRGVERILRFGFEMARTRRRRLTMITKSNALKYGMVLWDEVLEQIRAEYTDVEMDRQHADAAAMNFVRDPSRFDVVVASNLFGDILSDLAGAIVGGLGLAASANINPERRFPSMFEPVHGSAPDITGKGIANPVAAILSAAMMLDWLNLANAATLIRSAVEKTLKAGAGTPDLGGKLSTSQLTDRIIESMGGG
jgi:tartrate dehydrogenase/decarboxylase/D-malate dehydrogenase